MKILDHLEELIVTVMLSLMTLLTFMQVVMRYAFNAGYTWALELTTVFFAVMIFVGISYGVRVGAHIGVDALVKKMPPGLRRGTSIVVVVLCLVYAGLVIYGSWIYVSKMKMVGVELEDLPIPIWVVRAILPFGFALLALRFAQVLWALITGRSDSLHLGDEVAEALKLKSEESAS
ncbi:TRAP transporter small permease [Piscinibacter sp.]|uniref:TRAP transporter small permease n=1 Tax=Piscinibacter sp. TaxID=1903157 RepID=UPI002BBD3A01|nr:TRAP transporter small permease [Albitalea sp.]HUG21330.1 TRAP transporter small permease [Albitalea sp.]